MHLPLRNLQRIMFQQNKGINQRRWIHMIEETGTQCSKEAKGMTAVHGLRLSLGLRGRQASRENVNGTGWTLTFGERSAVGFRKVHC